MRFPCFPGPATGWLTGRVANYLHCNEMQRRYTQNMRRAYPDMRARSASIPRICVEKVAAFTAG